jgi:pterin-4a-carbinolamine dehydratase
MTGMGSPSARHNGMAHYGTGKQIMSANVGLPEGWKSVDRPPSLFRRFQFASYGETRAFLDRLAALSEETGLYPDLGFGTTHVNVTVYRASGGPPGTPEVEFATRAAALAFPV